MRLHRLGHRAEDHACLGQLLLEGRHHGDAIEHGIDGDARLLDAGKQLLLGERDAELGVGFKQLGIDVGEAFRSLGALGSRIVIKVLEIDLGVNDVRPGRLLHGDPAAIGLEPPVEQPVGLALLGRDKANGLLVQALGGPYRLDVGGEAVFVLVDVDLANAGDGLLHCRHGLLQIPFPSGLLRRYLPALLEPLDQLAESQEEALNIGTPGPKSKAYADGPLRKLWRNAHGAQYVRGLDLA